MKRDMDLVRKILLAMEAHPSGFAPHDFRVDGFSEDQVGYHAHLMTEAGLITSADVTTRGGNGPSAMPLAVTWAGYEFLDAARNDDTWAKAKAAVGRVAGVGFEVLKNVLIGYGTHRAMQSLG